MTHCLAKFRSPISVTWESKKLDLRAEVGPSSEQKPVLLSVDSRKSLISGFRINGPPLFYSPKKSISTCRGQENQVALRSVAQTRHLNQDRPDDTLSQGLARCFAQVLVGLAVTVAAGFIFPRAAEARTKTSVESASSVQSSVDNQAASSALATHLTKVGNLHAASSDNDDGGASVEQQAVEMLEEFLKKYPEDVSALRMLLRVRLKEGEFRRGIAILEKLIKLQPDQAEWVFIKAQTQQYAGDLSGAKQGFLSILKSEPFSARAMQGLTSVMRKSGEDSLVLGIVEDAIKEATQKDKKKEATNLRMLLGQLHALQGNADAAISEYDGIIEEDPADFRPYLCKGLIFSLMGDSAKADEHFAEFRKRCPTNFTKFLDQTLVKSSIEATRTEREERYKQPSGSKGRPHKPLQQPLVGGSSNAK